MRINGVIERRLLVNYRVAPEVLQALLPAPFRPQLVDGSGVAGICLIRMGELRPAGLPREVGLRSENAAHRIAVEWETPAGTRCGVYIVRRDTGSRLNTLAGGRLFPGKHSRARFDVSEDEGRVRVAYTSADGAVSVDVGVCLADTLQSSRLFGDVEEASAFFETGSVGFSPAHGGGVEGLRLHTDKWAVQPVTVERAVSSWFSDRRLFPEGSVNLDSALLMRQVPVSWRPVAAPRTQ